MFDKSALPAERPDRWPAAHEGGETALPSPRGTWWVRHYGSYRGIFVDLLLALAIQIAIGALFVVITGLIATALGHSFADGVRWTATSPAALPVDVILTDIGLLLLLWFRAAGNHLDWSLFGLARRQLTPQAGRAIGIGITLGVATVIVTAVLGQLLSRLGLNQNGQYNQLIVPLEHAPLWVAVVTTLLGAFVAPPVEEAFFRGYIFRALRRTKPVFWAYAVSASAFAAVHLYPDQFPVFFVAGLILAAAYARTNNMLANITAHATNNGISFILAFLPVLLHH